MAQGGYAFPPLWYGLLLLVSLFGVLTWYLRNFTQRLQLTKLSALSGVTSMLLLLWWTFTSF
jgi:apolipoprotein N-acyltransferase